MAVSFGLTAFFVDDFATSLRVVLSPAGLTIVLGHDSNASDCVANEVK